LASERVERRLTAILAADVAGYSRLMAADEEGTLAKLKANRSALVDPKITEHRGHIVKTTGDGMLVTFASVVDAVRCAVDVQRGMAVRNAETQQDDRIEFHIGINVGDMVIDGGDIFGDGVNIAARLEGIAEPCGICVSGRVHEDVQGKLAVDFDDMGEQQLKNIARPVRVYCVRLGASEPEARARPALALPDKPSTAVLAFQNMSGDPEQEYFADGVVEDIITALSRFKNLFVIADEAVRLARRAGELGKDDAVALCWGGWALAYVIHDIDAASALVDRALALNPNLATAWCVSGWMKIYVGEPELAIDHAGRAMRLSPLDPNCYLMLSVRAFGHLLAGRFDQASVWAEKAISERPDFVAGLRCAAASYALAGRQAEAEKLMTRARALDPLTRLCNLKEQVPIRRPEDFSRYAEGLRMAGHPE